MVGGKNAQKRKTTWAVVLRRPIEAASVTGGHGGTIEDRAMTTDRRLRCAAVQEVLNPRAPTLIVDCSCRWPPKRADSVVLRGPDEGRESRPSARRSACCAELFAPRLSRGPSRPPDLTGANLSPSRPNCRLTILLIFFFSI